MPVLRMILCAVVIATAAMSKTVYLREGQGSSSESSSSEGNVPPDRPPQERLQQPPLTETGFEDVDLRGPTAPPFPADAAASPAGILDALNVPPDLEDPQTSTDPAPLSDQPPYTERDLQHSHNPSGSGAVQASVTVENLLPEVTHTQGIMGNRPQVTTPATDTDPAPGAILETTPPALPPPITVTPLPIPIRTTLTGSPICFSFQFSTAEPEPEPARGDNI